MPVTEEKEEKDTLTLRRRGDTGFRNKKNLGCDAPHAEPLLVTQILEIHAWK